VTGIVLYLALAAFGVLTGVGAGILGVGGGTLMVPFLTLAIGLSQPEAEATSLLVVLPTAIVASIVLSRRGIGNLSVALRFGALGAGGGVLGALAALALPANMLRLVFAFFLLLVSVRLVRDALRTR
jgi:uncharacterized membrane protein YfcA